MGIVKAQDFSAEDIVLMQDTVNLCKELIITLANAKYKGVGKHFFFCNNVCINLLGNFILDTMDPDIEGALKNNIKSTINEIQNWFEKVKAIKKEAH